MPHSNDRTIVSAAGDATVRVFDVEYSGHSARRQAASEAGLTSSVFANTSRLNEGDTNAKVFRSHSDRVKRIVTESSPFYFLTCSEDGEVRQWDVREPESTYPGTARHYFHGPGSNTTNTNVPPPLISYKRYQIDLNTISCSPSRPHYIALGGNHLHCFLHDRRMLGRDRLAEQGKPSSNRRRSAIDDEEMAQATQCVRRFAPDGRPRMGRMDTGHITACKISDADPNELIASWSGDHIYSFNIDESSSSRKKQFSSTRVSDQASGSKGKVKESRDRKRKRVNGDPIMSLESAERGSSKQRTSSDSAQPEDLSLRVNYGNGQREEIPIAPPRERNSSSEPRVEALPDFQKQSHRIAKGTVTMRMSMFSPKAQGGKTSNAPPQGSLAWYTPSMCRTLIEASSILPEIEDIIRTWRYPVDPQPAVLAFQKKLRRDRESSARFVQATGTLARVLGGKLRTLGGANADAAKLEKFIHIQPALNEGPIESPRERFGYDFLKAICLWLDSGPGGLVRGFTRSSSSRSVRNPIVPDSGQDEASIDAIDEQLIPYLLKLASPTKPILNIEATPFEIDENRIVFANECAAVLAFAQAVKIPFEDITTGAVLLASPTSADRAAAQDRSAALRFWGLKVARGVLIEASVDVNFHLVDTCFGGLGDPDHAIRADERRLARLLTQIDDEDDDSDEEVREATILTRPRASAVRESTTETGTTSTEETDEPAEREVVVPMDLLAELIGEGEAIDPDELETPDSEVDAEEGDDEDADIFDDDDDDASPTPEDLDTDSEDYESPHHILFRSGRLKSLQRSRVNLNVPVSTHSRQYEGHCNVKTVKDVNYFGLQDEYVVSGSDSGHLFIWDRKTTKLVNILEGDGEVVNVVQGHPHEPMLAVSGIDHTVKIFSADARARRDARLGIGVRKVDESEFSSIQGLGLGRRRRRARAVDPGPLEPSDPESQAQTERAEWAAGNTSTDSENEDGQGRGPPVADGGLSSRKRMWDEYRILSANDSERRGSSRGEYISVSSIPLALNWFLGLV